MGIGIKLSELLELRHKKPGTLASETGINKNTIYAIIKRDSTKVNLSILEAIAENLGVSIDYFFDKQTATPFTHPDIQPITRTYKLPLLGPVAAGQPINAAPEDGEMIEVPYDPGKADAALTVKGDSMSPRYLNGDVVFIRFQDDVDDGQIAAVCIDDTVTLKKVYHIPNGVYLVSENPVHPPMTYTLEDANNIHIVGLAVGFMRWEY